MPGDPYYASPAWRQLRTAALRRDGYRCTTPGCGATAKTARLSVDHIVSRRSGGADALSNLVTRCGSCDAMVKEDSTGRRRAGGTPKARGCDVDGMPRDPRHPWNAGHAPSA